MARRDLVALYGRLSVVMVVFAFVAAIVAAPVLQKIWTNPVTAATNGDAPTLRQPLPSVNLVAEKQG